MSDVWYMLQDADRYVYHYTSAATLTDYILPSGKLRFSRFQNVNDPREAKEWSFDYAGKPDNPNFDIMATQNEMNDRLKRRWRVGCFVLDVDEALVTKEREDRGADTLKAGYERGHSRPRMWSQYGENHKGTCLIFDKQKLGSEIRSRARAADLILYAGQVKYRNPPVFHREFPNSFSISLEELKRLGIDEYVTAHVQNYWKELFFLKSEDWAQEREFRWVVQGDGDDDFFVDIQDSLFGLAMGEFFPIGRKPAVGNYAMANDLEVATMRWRNGFPQPEPEHPRLLAGST